ncbi:polysaccharide deacetylase family protein [Blautia schinkii]|nr:polysaccharide deacetylase family protein [Blautia schinkii]
MDKRVLRERMRRKKRQLLIRKLTTLGIGGIGAILLVVFIIRGVILPIVHSVGGKEPGNTVEVQAQTAEADPNAAIRQPLKGQGDVGKVSAMTPGWHEDENGRWYQNADGTYFAQGFQEIDGTTYSFDNNGYVQTGWVSKGVRDYFFNDDGSYNPNERRKMLALTFDDGPGEHTPELLDCLEENNARATFFMVGPNVQAHPETVKRMAELGCEIGSHTWDHYNLKTLSLDQVKKQFDDTDDALIAACGQPASVARAPFGEWNQDIIDTADKPFFMWTMDTLDWQLLDADADYNAVMNGDLTDGSIILMHDIHEPSVNAALRIIPDLVAQGYKLVTVSELAEAKGVKLQNASYFGFWDSTLASGEVAGYEGDPNDLSDSGSGGGDETDLSDGSSEGDGLDDGSGEDDYSDGSGDDEEYLDDGSDYTDE